MPLIIPKGFHYYPKNKFAYRTPKGFVDIHLTPERIVAPLNRKNYPSNNPEGMILLKQK